MLIHGERPLEGVAGRGAGNAPQQIGNLEGRRAIRLNYFPENTQFHALDTLKDYKMDPAEAGAKRFLLLLVALPTLFIPYFCSTTFRREWESAWAGKKIVRIHHQSSNLSLNTVLHPLTERNLELTPQRTPLVLRTGGGSVALATLAHIDQNRRRATFSTMRFVDLTREEPRPLPERDRHSFFAQVGQGISHLVQSVGDVFVGRPLSGEGAPLFCLQNCQVETDIDAEGNIGGATEYGTIDSHEEYILAQREKLLSELDSNATIPDAQKPRLRREIEEWAVHNVVEA